MKPRGLLFLGMLLASITTGSSLLLAQQWGWRGPGMTEEGWGYGRHGMMGGGGWGRGMMGAGCPMVAFDDDGETTTFIEGRLAFLKAELKITDAQNDVWTAYGQALKNNLETMKTMHELMQSTFEAKTPVERLDGRVAAMETRLSALKEMQPALAKLYEVLDETQKDKANNVLTFMGCMM